MLVSPFWKTIVAGVVGGVNFAYGLIADGDFTATDERNLGAWILSSLAVYLVPNKPASTPSE